MPEIGGTKWGPSATMGTTGGVVTWSITPAGTDITRFASYGAQGTQAVAPDSFIMIDYTAILRQAFDRWAQFGNIEFIQVQDPGGQAASAAASNPDIRISFGLIDGEGGTYDGLGFYPSPNGGYDGDILFDITPWYDTVSTYLLRLALHEIGHAIGLGHVDINAMMNPSLPVTDLTADDITGVQTIYGVQDFGANVYDMPATLADQFLLDGAPLLTINGNALDNGITGSSGGETINGLAGADRLNGGGGNDTLAGGAGADQLRGDAGNDTLTIDSLDTVVDGGADIDTVNLTGPGMVFNLGFTNVEIVNGTAGNDQVDGSVGTTGSLTLNGLGGNDTLTGGAAGDSISGGDADDGLYGNSGNDTLNGGAGVDFLNGGADSDTISGGSENDALYGEAGNDTISGDAGNEYAFGGAGNDSLTGGTGNDYLVGDSNVIGETGITGLDTMDGGDDSDTLIGGYLSDSLNGGFGNDALYGDFDDVNAASNPGAADTLIGGAGTDFMFGGGGNDVLDGGADSDTLIGGSENDTMNGGEGSDSYYGKDGIDTFVFSDNWGTDGVWDFADGSEIFDLTAVTGLTSFAQLTITDQSVPGVNYADVAFGANHIFVVGVTAAQLTAADFLL